MQMLAPPATWQRGNLHVYAGKRIFARLAAATSGVGLRAALEKLSLDLLRESDALERERAVLGNKLQRD
jgi:hypothetical protein